MQDIGALIASIELKIDNLTRDSQKAVSLIANVEKQLDSMASAAQRAEKTMAASAAAASRSGNEWIGAVAKTSDSWLMVESQARKSTKNITGFFDEMADRIKNRVMFMLAQTISLVLLYEIFNKIKAAAKESMEYMAELESATLGIASIYLAQGQYIDTYTGKSLQGADALKAAMTDATATMDRLKAANFETIATLDQIVNIYEGILPVAMSKGMDKDKVIAMTTALTQAAGALKINFGLAATEMREILEGVVTKRNVLAAKLGVSADDIKNIIDDADKLFAYLMKKMDAFAVAGVESQKTWKGLWSNIKDISNMVGSISFKPLFEGIKGYIMDITKYVIQFKTITSEKTGETFKIAEINPDVIRRAETLAGVMKDLWGVLTDFPKGVFGYFYDLRDEMDKTAKSSDSLASRLKNPGWEGLKQTLYETGSALRYFAGVIGTTFAFVITELYTFAASAWKILNPIGNMMIGVVTLNKDRIAKAWEDWKQVGMNAMDDFQDNLSAYVKNVDSQWEAHVKRMAKYNTPALSLAKEPPAPYKQNPPPPKPVDDSLLKLQERWKVLYETIMNKGNLEDAVAKVEKTFDELFKNITLMEIDFAKKKGLSAAIIAQIAEAREHLAALKPYEIAIASINVDNIKREASQAQEVIGNVLFSPDAWERSYGNMQKRIQNSIDLLTVLYIGATNRNLAGEKVKIQDAIAELNKLQNKLTDDFIRGSARLNAAFAALQTEYGKAVVEMLPENSAAKLIETINEKFSNTMTNSLKTWATAGYLDPLTDVDHMFRIIDEDIGHTDEIITAFLGAAAKGNTELVSKMSQIIELRKTWKVIETGAAPAISDTKRQAEALAIEKEQINLYIEANTLVGNWNELQRTKVSLIENEKNTALNKIYQEQIELIVRMQKASITKNQTELDYLTEEYYANEHLRTVLEEVFAVKLRMQKEISEAPYLAGLKQGLLDLQTFYEDVYSQMIEATKNVDNEMKSAFEDFFDYTSKGFGDLKKLASSILHSIYMEAVKMAVVNPIMKNLWGTIGSIASSIGIGGGSSAVGAGYGAEASNVSESLGLGSMYARGGIATMPSIFGEAGPEAAVPLPDGRRIPVDLRDYSKGGHTYHITVPIANYGNGNTLTEEEIARKIKRVLEEHV